MRKWMLAILTLALLLTGVASAEIERHYSLPLGWTQTDDGTSDGLITDPDGKTYDSISETIWGVPRYRLPGGWRYGENATVIGPDGTVYENILEHNCMMALNFWHWGYGDFNWMESEKLLSSAPNQDENADLSVIEKYYNLPIGWDQIPDGTPDGLIITPEGKTYDSISETIWGTPRYQLPDGWRYGEGGCVITPDGRVYENMLLSECMNEIGTKYYGFAGDLMWGWLNFEFMETERLLPGLTPELGDDGTSLTVLISVAGFALVGTIFARRKAKHA